MAESDNTQPTEMERRELIERQREMDRAAREADAEKDRPGRRRATLGTGVASTPTVRRTTLGE